MTEPVPQIDVEEATIDGTVGDVTVMLSGLDGILVQLFFVHVAVCEKF